MVGYAKSSVLIIFAVLVSACSTREESRIIRYEAVQSEGIIYNGLVFSEEKGLRVAYVKPYSDSYLEEPMDFNSGAFIYRDKIGLLSESGTGLSVPRNIHKVRKWNNGSYICNATLDGGHFRIECSNGMNNLHYEYSPDIGVTKLHRSCRPGEYCEFLLVSRRGLFGEL